ncbi:hypothetical protein [Hyphomonas sp.]|uniref:hypothetical protein n=1 Tax=Hyphomonas sp. TaxID=87 RepID=UPI001D9F00BD|nr:hypothetical protein [Hyphomonas sp.]MBU3919257.1 hypothetical protein [Alphaproteobacteria bacterium]MBU4060772.1 hypothetical protein [Alphaproteobacteria bacterium]MBU4164756.1 hypothetical protein [Alphaproteobacteria bacterium]
MKIARTLALSGLAAIVAGCGTTETPAPAPAGTAAAAGPAAPAGPDLTPRIVSLPFRVDITFSADALDRLNGANADVGVSADYYGVPKDPDADGLDPELGVWLGGEMETIDPGNRSLTLKGQIDAARVAREVSGDARVRIMVFPVRAYGPQAAITCTEFDAELPLTVETGGTVHCTLNGK